jgi:hypothetical protein
MGVGFISLLNLQHQQKMMEQLQIQDSILELDSILEELDIIHIEHQYRLLIHNLILQDFQEILKIYILI